MAYATKAQLDAETAARKAADATETKARQDADGSLSAALAALTARVAVLEQPVPVPVPPPVTPPPPPPPNFTTIQAAVNAAASGATITVPPGTYPETVTIGKPLTLIGPGAIVAGGGTRQYAFVLNAAVTLDGFEVLGHATPLQDGAIRCLVAGSVIRRVRGHDNAGPAITLRASTTVEDCEFDHNGQQGYHGSGPQDSVIRRTHVHHNNLRVAANPGGAHPKQAPNGQWWPVDPFWEAGAGKITRATSILFEDCEIDHNGGVGLWADIASNNWTIRRCRVHDNDLAGIMFEISTGAVIEDNVVWHNGELDNRGWGWPGNILISSATGPIECRRNLVAHGLAGISVITQNRGDKPAGSGSNIHLTDNTVCEAAKGVGWYDDWSGGFAGKINTGNVVYTAASPARDAILDAAGVPLT